MPTRKVSEDLSREALGLRGLTTRKVVLEQLDKLAVAAAVKHLGDQRALGLHVVQGEVDGQFDQVGDAGGVGRRDARQVGRHVGDHHVGLAAGHGRLQLAPAPRARGSRPAGTGHALDRLHRQDVQRDDGAVQFPRGSAAGRQLAAHVLAPGARRRAQVDHQVARLDQAQGLVDFLELVGGAGAVALPRGELDVGVVDVVVQPRLVDLLAFRFRLIRLSRLTPIIRACLQFN